MHEDLSVAKHIREFPDLSCVFDRLIERYAEVVRRQNRDVGVFGFFILETVSVYDGKPAFVIFLRDESAGVLAERADFIVVRRDVTDKFAFVQHVVDFFHNFVATLNPDADIDDARTAFYAVLSAQIVKPVRADATDCHNHSFRLYDEFLLCNVVDEMRAFAHSVVYDKVARRRVEKNVHAVVDKEFFDAGIHLVRLFRSEMANGTIDEFQSCCDCATTDFFDLNVFAVCALDFLIRAEIEINPVGVVDKFQHGVVTDKLGKVAADFRRQRKFPVGKRARARKARGDVAVRFAIYALARFVFRAVTSVDVSSLFDDGDGFVAVLTNKFQRRENTRRSRTYNQDVAFDFRHIISPKMLFVVCIDFNGHVASVVFYRATEKSERIEIRTRRVFARGAHDNLIGVEFKRHRHGIFRVFFGRHGFPFQQDYAFVDIAAAFQFFEHGVGFGDVHVWISASARQNNFFGRILLIKFFGKVQTLSCKRG